MRVTAASYDCSLIGGDISMWDGSLVLTVTVLAEPDGIEPVLRRGAQAGDSIYVTGRLGGSLETINGYTHHLDFTPRIGLARKLAGRSDTRPHCMIDLSDGLAKDIRHLLTSAVIQVDRLPLSDAAHQAARRSGRPAWQHAVGDGEDYELLFTAPSNSMPDQIDRVPITCIGFVPAETGDIVMMQDDEPVDVEDLGWEHRGR